MNKLKNKKSVTILLLLLGLTDIIEAQTLDKSPSQEWYYGFANHEIWISRYFYQHLVTAGDTTIMGKKCVIMGMALMQPLSDMKIWGNPLSFFIENLTNYYGSMRN